MTEGQPRQTAGVALTIAAALLIAWFTLRPGDPGPPAVTGTDYVLTDIVLNVILFVPLGAGLALAGWRSRSAVVAGTLASVAIELAQLGVVPERVASVHDVITNGLGTALGALLVAGWTERRRWQRRLGPLLAGVLVVVWVFGGLQMVPSLPGGGEPWFGFWAHEFAGTVLFPGRVLSLSVEGIPLPDGPIPSTALLRERLARSDTIRMATVVITGGPVVGRAQLVGVGSGSGEELASIWQIGTAVVARERLRLSDRSMRTLWVRLDRALAASAGDTVRVDFMATRRALELKVARHGQARVTSVRLGPELFWTGFLPFEYEASDGIPWWPLSGVALIFLVLGLLLAPYRWAAIAAAAAALLIGPLISRTPLPGSATIAVGLAALAAGSVLAHRDPERSSSRGRG